MSKRKDATLWKCIRNTLAAAAIGMGLALTATGAFATTLLPNTRHDFPFTGDTLELHFKPESITDYSYSAGGVIQWANSEATCNWCGNYAGQWQLSHYNPEQTVKIYFGELLTNVWLRIHPTHGVSVVDVVEDAPAPVPLPASIGFLILGLLALVGWGCQATREERIAMGWPCGEAA